VNEWISYECSDEDTCTPKIRNSSTRSHALEGGNRSRNRSKNCKCIQTGLNTVLKALEIMLTSALLFFKRCNSGGINHIDSTFLVNTRNNDINNI
jgi:hypothetical protein